MRIRALLSSALAVLVMAPAADAHVTINPGEWEAGGFARFAIRVPTERPDASTRRVTVQLPEGLFFVTFQPKPGWKRTVRMEQFDEPVELFGEPVEERVAEVTWEGGEIAPGEFDEFGVSARIPETPGERLLFPSIQEYSNGEVVRWIDPDPEAEEPAPAVTVLPPADDGAAAGDTEQDEDAEAAQEATGSGGDEAAAPEAGDTGRTNLALGFGIAGLVAGLAALAVAFLRTRRT